MSSPTPRKRQNVSANQSQITNFFSRTQAPVALPDSVQSGLLSVGMRVRKSVPEGYKSGSYAFNKHLPSANVSVPASPPTSPRKKRAFEDERQQKGVKSIPSPPPPPPASITTWARRAVKVPTGASGKGSKKRNFYQAVERKDVAMTEGTAEDFGEAEFLLPMEE
jgi:hypothetical protein